MSGYNEYKCPCCGGALQFDSTAQKVKCPYCDTEFDIENIKKLEEAISNENKEDRMEWDTDAGTTWKQEEIDGMGVFSCKSCGGEIVGDKNTAATNCPFCGNPIVLSSQFDGKLRPDCVIPFKLDKKKAKEGLKNHIKGKKLLPSVFEDENHIDEIKGIYVPFWLFDADANAQMRFKGTKVRFWSDSKYNYTETSYYSIHRNADMDFKYVPVDGSSQIDNDLMESIEPFEFSEAVDFETAYLAGYFADKYDVSDEESKSRANDRIKTSVRETIKKSASGYNTLTEESCNISLDNNQVKYALYPVWMLSTTWNGKSYTFAMNGQTGKFVGNLPIDKKKWWKYYLMYTGISSVLSFIVIFIATMILR